MPAAVYASGDVVHPQSIKSPSGSASRQMAFPVCRRHDPRRRRGSSRGNRRVAFGQQTFGGSGRRERRVPSAQFAGRQGIGAVARALDRRLASGLHPILVAPERHDSAVSSESFQPEPTSRERIHEHFASGSWPRSNSSRSRGSIRGAGRRPRSLVAVAALVFAVVRPATWEASQALIIRNEATGGQNDPGSFDHAEQMKTVQETILELAKSRGVLRGALAEVGPPADHAPSTEAWPSRARRGRPARRRHARTAQGRRVRHDRGLLSDGQGPRPAEAVALADALCDQLEARFQEIRDAKAQSMIGELAKAVKLAHADLDEATARLSTIEKQVGPDLAELRILNDATNGDSTLRRTAGEISHRASRGSGQLRNQRRASRRCSNRPSTTRANCWPRRTNCSNRSRPCDG